MIQFRGLVKFLLVFLVSFAVLILPWHGLQGAYASFYRFLGNTCFGSFSPVAGIELQALPADDPAAKQGRDTKMVFLHRASGISMPMAVDTRFQGYTPTAFVVALVLASPVPWRRRLRALVWCLAAMTFYVAVRQYIFIASVIYHPAPWVSKLLDFAYWVVVESFAGVFIIPVMIWAAVTFRRADLDGLRGTAALGARTR